MTARSEDQGREWSRQGLSGPSSLYDLLTRNLRLPSERFFLFGDTWHEAESILEDSRHWAATFRRRLAPGDRILLASRPRPAVLSVLLAAMREGLTIALAGEAEEPLLLGEEVDARAIFSDRQGPHTLFPERGDLRSIAFCPRESRLPPSPEARFLIRSSGTSGSARWIALSEKNVQAVLESHLPHLGLSGGTVLSSLPWAHCFGLVLELFASLAGGASRLVRDAEGGRNAETLVRLAQRSGITHFNAVPLTIERISERPGGRAFLESLEGGIVGGAPISPRVARLLSGTRLRAGYGQTEASPGISLGNLGDFVPGWLGRPIGCEAWIGPDGVLVFRGANACLGHWDRENGLSVLDPDRFVSTGDLARREREGFVFEGRAAASFKLANGRFVEAARIEQRFLTRGGALEALLRSRDGRSLELFLTMPEDRRPSDETLAACLGPLASLPLSVSLVEGSSWLRTRKGEVDRARMAILDASIIEKAA